MQLTKKAFSLFAAAAAIAATSALADDIELGLPSHAGTGCPSNTVSASLSPDNRALSILFDQYVAEAGGDSRKMLDRKNCDVAIPIRVPQGYSFSIVSIDYRGFNGIPYGASSRLTVEYFLNYGGAGSTRGARRQYDFRGPLMDDYLINNQIGLEAVVWSPCGASVNLRTSTTLMVQTNRQREQVMSTVDSMEVNAGVIYQLQWRRCG